MECGKGVKELKCSKAIHCTCLLHFKLLSMLSTKLLPLNHLEVQLQSIKGWIVKGCYENRAVEPSSRAPRSNRRSGASYKHVHVLEKRRLAQYTLSAIVHPLGASAC